jgi:arsenate reductase (thioredoxin)
MSDKPVVLFACIHNSGRSVAARILTEHYAKGAVEARSAGSAPKDSVNPLVAEVLAGRGLSTAAEKPTKLDSDVVEAADVVVTMGCGETCPIFPGKRYEDWAVDDPRSGHRHGPAHRRRRRRPGSQAPRRARGQRERVRRRPCGAGASDIPRPGRGRARR